MADLQGNASPVEGSAAHDSPVAENPVAVGARANANEPAVVSADGDAVWSWADLVGRLVTQPQFPANVAGATHGPVTANLTASGDTQVIAAPGAGLSIHVLSYWLSNRDAATEVVALREGAAGTIRVRGMLAADGGGVKHSFQTPWKLPANTALTGNLASAGNVDVNVEFYVAA